MVVFSKKNISCFFFVHSSLILLLLSILSCSTNKILSSSETDKNPGSSGSNKSHQTITQNPDPNDWIFEGFACAPDQNYSQKGHSPAVYCKDRNPSEWDHLYIKFSVDAGTNQDQAFDADAQLNACNNKAKKKISENSDQIITDYLEMMVEFGRNDFRPGTNADFVLNQVKNKGVYNCCPMDDMMGNCLDKQAQKSFNYCICTGYYHIPGGKKVVMDK